MGQLSIAFRRRSPKGRQRKRERKVGNRCRRRRSSQVRIAITPLLLLRPPPPPPSFLIKASSFAWGEKSSVGPCSQRVEGGEQVCLGRGETREGKRQTADWMRKVGTESKPLPHFMLYCTSACIIVSFYCKGMKLFADKVRGRRGGCPMSLDRASHSTILRRRVGGDSSQTQRAAGKPRLVILLYIQYVCNGEKKHEGEER